MPTCPKQHVQVAFDGVLHVQDDNWRHTRPFNPAPRGRPVPGARDFVIALVEQGYAVSIYSDRLYYGEGLDGVKAWLQRYGFPSRLVLSSVFHEDRPFLGPNALEPVITGLQARTELHWNNILDKLLTQYPPTPAGNHDPQAAQAAHDAQDVRDDQDAQGNQGPGVVESEGEAASISISISIPGDQPGEQPDEQPGDQTDDQTGGDACPSSETCEDGDPAGDGVPNPEPQKSRRPSRPRTPGAARRPTPGPSRGRGRRAGRTGGSVRGAAS